MNDELPLYSNAEVMRELTKMCLEQATEDLAKMAEKFAVTLPAEIDGKTALIAFASAIRSTNAKVWPAKRA